jgi:hypothetical protein
MKKLILITLVLICGYSCIKRKALKFDPELVGTWVSNEDSGKVYTYLFITPDGIGTYTTDGTSSEEEAVGEVKYSLFERKMWIGLEKFKVEVWRSGRLDGVGAVKMKEYKTHKDTIYAVDEKMVLKTGVLGRTVDFYRIKK